MMSSDSRAVRLKALFLSHASCLLPGGGGQQQCTREYRETLSAAGFDLLDCLFETDRSWTTRVRRWAWRRPYANVIPRTYFDHVADVAREHRPAWVFCNLYNFVPFGGILRQRIGEGVRLVLLSHGLASVDELHAVRFFATRGKSNPRTGDASIGRMLRVEASGLPAFDHVFCLAPFEVEICRWLGATSVSWLPRTIPWEPALAWRPTGNRIGCVGTLDHPPNQEGIELFCAALANVAPAGLRLRLVTRSRAVAADLASRYRFVDDLGPMDEPGALEREASTWSVFVNPIFCHAMGCSTKVATALAWGIPVLTTPEGLRGYDWRTGELPTPRTAVGMAREAVMLLDSSRAAACREEVLKAAKSSTTSADIATRIRRDLRLAPGSTELPVCRRLASRQLT